jgi:hypothetical protein
VRLSFSLCLTTDLACAGDAANPASKTRPINAPAQGNVATTMTAKTDQTMAMRGHALPTPAAREGEHYLCAFFALCLATDLACAGDAANPASRTRPINAPVQGDVATTVNVKTEMMAMRGHALPTPAAREGK